MDKPNKLKLLVLTGAVTACTSMMTGIQKTEAYPKIGHITTSTIGNPNTSKSGCFSSIRLAVSSLGSRIRKFFRSGNSSSKIVVTQNSKGGIQNNAFTGDNNGEPFVKQLVCNVHDDHRGHNDHLDFSNVTSVARSESGNRVIINKSSNNSSGVNSNGESSGGTVIYAKVGNKKQNNSSQNNNGDGDGIVYAQLNFKNTNPNVHENTGNGRNTIYAKLKHNNHDKRPLPPIPTNENNKPLPEEPPKPPVRNQSLAISHFSGGNINVKKTATNNEPNKPVPKPRTTLRNEKPVPKPRSNKQ